MPDAPPAPSSVLLVVAYDGRRYSGFARQPNARTIAGTLDGAIQQLDPRASMVRGSSRTDAGVHALAHPVAFDPTRTLPTRAWAHNINRELPEEIVVKRVYSVTGGYDPRREARHKTYRYVVRQAKVRDPFDVERSWRLPERLNHVTMGRAAEALLGEHDFRAFRGAQDDRENTVRRILRVEVRKRSSDDAVLEIEVNGTGFLYKMVRIIVGSLVDIGRDRLSPDCFERAFVSGDRGDLGMTAPPGGLYLQHVELAGELVEGWPEPPFD